MSRTQVVSSRKALRTLFAVILCILELGTIQKPVSNTLEARPVVPVSQRISVPRAEVHVAPAEIHQIEKPAELIRESAPSPRTVQLTEPSRGWILPDSTWEAFGNSVVKLDFGREGQETYIGLHFEVPFGGR